MTGKYTADGLLKDIAAVGAKAVHNVANSLLDGSGLAHAGANLQKFKNLGDGAGPDYASASGPVSSGRTAHAVSATTQNRRRPKEERQSEGEEEGDNQADPQTNKRSKDAKWAVSKAAVAHVACTKSKRDQKSDVLDWGRHDVDERTRRDFYEFDDE